MRRQGLVVIRRKILTPGRGCGGPPWVTKPTTVLAKGKDYVLCGVGITACDLGNQ